MNRRARTAQRSQRRVFRPKRPFPFVIVFRQLSAGLLMLAAGLGIAFRAKPLVKQNAEQAISTLGLDGILYLIGVRDKDQAELLKSS